MSPTSNDASAPTPEYKSGDRIVFTKTIIEDRNKANAIQFCLEGEAGEIIHHQYGESYLVKTLASAATFVARRDEFNPA